MKKILLLLVSGLLVLSLAGPAMAIGIDFPPSSYVNGVPNVYITPDGITVTKLSTVVTTSVAGDYAFLIETDTDSLEASIENLNGGSISWGSYTSSSTSTINLGVANYDCDLYVRGSTDGLITIYATGPDGAEPPQEVEVFVKSNIPEFPTVALPVAAILGLVFIFGRRKEGL
ncbi:PEF-CTERM sorting domain-containing protein [Methanosarcina sp. Mfa9]|uniref:PEF-CTERM sorting domain-containing protein n=1 Tax=Methanosarcina sp. Mfa9 TaxID=3439063 RepID=UPI003F87BF46